MLSCLANWLPLNLTFNIQHLTLNNNGFTERLE